LSKNLAPIFFEKIGETFQSAKRKRTPKSDDSGPERLAKKVRRQFLTLGKKSGCSGKKLSLVGGVLAENGGKSENLESQNVAVPASEQYTRLSQTDSESIDDSGERLESESSACSGPGSESIDVPSSGSPSKHDSGSNTEPGYGSDITGPRFGPDSGSEHSAQGDDNDPESGFNQNRIQIRSVRQIRIEDFDKLVPRT
jgi:hypothetical protein